MIKATMNFTTYSLVTIMLPSTSIDELRSFLSEKLADKRLGSWLQEQVLVLDYSKAQDKDQLNYSAVQELSSSMGFLVVGLTDVFDDELKVSLKQQGARIFAKKTKNDNNTDKLDNSNLTPKTEDSKQNNKDKIAQSQENTNTVESVTSESNVESNTMNEPKFDPSTTMVHVGNVRSGTTLYAKNKSLVVIGNVGAGADIVADDCVFVFGDVRGRIMAGAATKNASSIVYCRKFEPQLVSIAGVYYTIDDVDENIVGKKVLAQLKDDKLVFTPQD